jgi:hypothetical protein
MRKYTTYLKLGAFLFILLTVNEIEGLYFMLQLNSEVMLQSIGIDTKLIPYRIYAQLILFLVALIVLIFSFRTNHEK